MSFPTLANIIKNGPSGFKHPGSVDDLETFVKMCSGLRMTAISGGSAGNHTVTGIATEDVLVSVLHFTPSTSIASLTSEFTISAADTINNGGGTDTSSDFLVVLYYDKSGPA